LIRGVAGAGGVSGAGKTGGLVTSVFPAFKEEGKRKVAISKHANLVFIAVKRQSYSFSFKLCVVPS
jgi:hypothetical protein